VRILGESQREVAEAAREQLNVLDLALGEACAGGEHDEFAAALTTMLGRVRELGSPLPLDHQGPSDVVLPSADASLAEVIALISEEGLIPG
jgi:hypothetical protein